jgi:hypothetical protein
MPKRFIQIVSIGPTDIVLWINDQKYDFSAPPDVIKHFLFVQRHNQGKALAYLREHCNKSWNVTDESKLSSKENLSYRTSKIFEVGAKVRIKTDIHTEFAGMEGTIVNSLSFPGNWAVYFSSEPGSYAFYESELELI